MPSPVRLMVLRYCLGMIMSVSTLIILSGAATPSSVVNFCIVIPSSDACQSHGASAAAGQGRVATCIPMALECDPLLAEFAGIVRTDSERNLCVDVAEDCRSHIVRNL